MKTRDKPSNILNRIFTPLDSMSVVYDRRKAHSLFPLTHLFLRFREGEGGGETDEYDEEEKEELGETFDNISTSIPRKAVGHMFSCSQKNAFVNFHSCMKV